MVLLVGGLLVVSVPVPAPPPVDHSSHVFYVMTPLHTHTHLPGTVPSSVVANWTHLIQLDLNANVRDTVSMILYHECVWWWYFQTVLSMWRFILEILS